MPNDDTTTADSTGGSRADGEAGFTLVEQLVTLTVLSIVLIIVFGFLMNATGITARADANTRAEQDAINALRTVTEDLRSAKTVSECAGQTLDTCVTIEIQKSTVAGATCPKRVVTYKVVANKLNQTYNDYAANCTTVTKSVNRPLISGVQSTSIFTYYAKDGITPLNLAVANDLAMAPAAPAVKVALSVLYRKNVTPLSLSSFASLRNKR